MLSTVGTMEIDKSTNLEWKFTAWVETCKHVKLGK